MQPLISRCHVWARAVRDERPTPLRTATGRSLKTSGKDKVGAPRCRVVSTVSPVSTFSQVCGAFSGSATCEPRQNLCKRVRAGGAFERASHLGTMVIIQVLPLQIGRAHV